MRRGALLGARLEVRAAALEVGGACRGETAAVVALESELVLALPRLDGQALALLAAEPRRRAGVVLAALEARAERRLERLHLARHRSFRRASGPRDVLEG